MRGERDAHLLGPGPKRILSLDGGGTLGIIELAFLERIEALLGEHFANPAFRLCDEFDLIGGTSTGAIIAGCLALGKSVAEVTKLYLELAPYAFRRRIWRVPGLAPRFDARPLTRFLRELFGECTLESEEIRTGLAIMARRFDTGSPWLISNDPNAPYWHDPPDGGYIGNRHYRVADMVRASTAAPGFFSPQLLPIVQGEALGMFIDGGLSPYNNPSLALFMMSQVGAFGLRWKTGPEQLTLLSIGAGSYRRGLPQNGRPPSLAGRLALRAVMDSVADGQVLTLTLLQWLGETPQPWIINSEVGDLSGDMLAGRALLRFQRYDMPLEPAWLLENLGQQFSEKVILRLRQIDNPADMVELYAMASTVAGKQVKLEHFI